MASAASAKYSKKTLISLFNECALPFSLTTADIDDPIVSKESVQPFGAISEDDFDFSKGLVPFNSSPTAAKPYHKQGFKPNTGTGNESPGKEDWNFKRPYNNNKWPNQQNVETKIERSPVSKQKHSNKQEGSSENKEQEVKAENIETEISKLLKDLAIDTTFNIWYFIDMKGKTQGPITSNELVEYAQWGFINSESKFAIDQDKDDIANFKSIKNIDFKRMKEVADSKMKTINEEKEKIESETRKEAEKKFKEEKDASLKVEAEIKKKEDEIKRKEEEQKKQEEENTRKKVAETEAKENQKRKEELAKEELKNKEAQKQDLKKESVVQKEEESDEDDTQENETSQKKQKKQKQQKFAKPKGSNKQVEESSPIKFEEKKKAAPLTKKSENAIAKSPRKQEKPLQASPSAAKVVKASTTSQSAVAIDFEGWDIEEPKKIIVPAKPLTLDEIQKLEIEEQSKRGPAPVKPKPISMAKPESEKSWWYGAENNSAAPVKTPVVAPVAAPVGKKPVGLSSGSKAVSLEDIMKEQENRRKKK